MRFLKDRECNNGKNHNMNQGDCRAKAPIIISGSIVQVGGHTVPAIHRSRRHYYLYLSDALKSGNCKLTELDEKGCF